MEQIFAPWRMDWIAEEDPNSEFDGCVFCELPRSEADAGHRVLARADQAYAVLNSSPYNPGHTLVIPTTHTLQLPDLDDETLLSTFRLLQTMMEAIDDLLQPDGYNLGVNIGSAAGASIDDHIHVHLIPRWSGDTTFLPTSANTQVIPEALDETYGRIRDILLSFSSVEASDTHHAVDVAEPSLHE